MSGETLEVRTNEPVEGDDEAYQPGCLEEHSEHPRLSRNQTVERYVFFILYSHSISKGQADAPSC